MSLTQKLINRLKKSPQSIEFNNVMDVIAAEYRHTPSAFINGDQQNSAEQNQGSCKVLAFARMNSLSESETLALFGSYYRDDVLKNPQGSDHGNIRAFMRTGWSGVELAQDALQPID